MRMVLLLAVVSWLGLADLRAAPEWTIHEWGTFTSLQDEKGRTIGGINTDDEPVPRFVHRLADWVLQSPTEVPVIFFQGAPRCHPDVTMRLETPVIYFYPPESGTVAKASVDVRFRGGWLTEFYPLAAPQVDGLGEGKFQFGSLNSDSVSRLAWNDVEIGGNWGTAALTNTTEHVWTSPRAVNSALVRTANGEVEKFLFYRGVGHLDAPLKISRDGDQLVFRSQLAELEGALNIKSSWLVDIRRDKRVAFRALGAMTLDKDSSKERSRTAAMFAEQDYSGGNVKVLRGELKKALVNEGLFADEANALLNTWELSYFKSAGLRVFFVVPLAWTDHVLPLEISAPAKVNRVMIGRVELVSPEQRSGLQRLAKFAPETIKRDAMEIGRRFYGTLTNSASLVPERIRSDNINLASRGAKPLGELIDVPESYRTYLELGRFRNALVLDEVARNPSPVLDHFIKTYRLEGSRVDLQGR